MTARCSRVMAPNRGSPSMAARRGPFLLLALEASWPIGEAPSPRTLGDSSEGNHPISEDARRLLGREQLAAGESTGTCGVMANHTKSITQTLPVPKVCGDTGIRTTDHNRSKVNGTSLTTSPLVEGRKITCMP